MRKIFLLSDTHSHWNNEWTKYIHQADEIWHAGDIGSHDVLQQFISHSNNKTHRFVFGNIDNQLIRTQTNPYLVFDIEKLKILIVHIAGQFGQYNKNTQELIT
ncbi:MAG: metallophosphoesterase family protein, partial [Bacteroidia bacterium]|nr:metallophosphoesterase family protein [Bacteroidia bacterium]